MISLVRQPLIALFAFCIGQPLMGQASPRKDAPTQDRYSLSPVTIERLVSRLARESTIASYASDSLAWMGPSVIPFLLPAIQSGDKDAFDRAAYIINHEVTERRIAGHAPRWVKPYSLRELTPYADVIAEGMIVEFCRDSMVYSHRIVDAVMFEQLAKDSAAGAKMGPILVRGLVASAMPLQCANQVARALTSPPMRSAAQAALPYLRSFFRSTSAATQVGGDFWGQMRIVLLTLGELRDPLSAPEIIAAIQRHGVTRLAIFELGSSGAPVALRYLDSLHVVWPKNNVWLAEAYSVAGAPAIPQLLGILKADATCEDCLVPAIEALAKIGPPARAALPALRELTKSNAYRVRDSAKLAVAKISGVA